MLSPKLCYWIKAVLSYRYGFFFEICFFSVNCNQVLSSRRKVSRAQAEAKTKRIHRWACQNFVFSLAKCAGKFSIWFAVEAVFIFNFYCLQGMIKEKWSQQIDSKDPNRPLKKPGTSEKTRLRNLQRASRKWNHYTTTTFPILIWSLFFQLLKLLQINLKCFSNVFEI